MPKFKVSYTLTVSGTMEVEAADADEASDKVSEEAGYDVLCECGDGIPDVEVDDVMEARDAD